MKYLNEIRGEYEQGLINKLECIESMHEKHQALFEYASYMSSTNIKEIQILDDSIIMTTRDRNIKFICDKQDKRMAPLELLNIGMFEEECLDMMARLLKPGSSFFDIGANVGWYSMNFAKKNSNLDIYAFEPIPKTFSYLKKNVELNQLGSINLYDFGFSNTEKEVIFYYDAEGSANSSLTNLSLKNNIEEISSYVTTVDLFVEKENIKIDFIKCDVEGAELFVFEGAKKTLQEQKPMIFTEMLRKWAAKFDYHPNQIIELLSEFGYKCFIISNNKLEEILVVTDTTIETNFIFLHGSKHDKEIVELTR